MSDGVNINQNTAVERVEGMCKPRLLKKGTLVFLQILFLPESTEGVAVGATTAMDYEKSADSTVNDAETVEK